MIKKLTLAVITFVSLFQFAYSQTIDSVTSKLFFEVNVNSSVPELLKYLNNVSGINQVKNDSSIAVYSPDTSQAWNNYSFEFSNHPYFKPKFDNGKISIGTVKIKNVEHLIDIDITLPFNSKKVFELEYVRVKNLLLKWDGKPKKQRETSSTYEVLEFRNKQSPISIMLTQSQGEKSYYLLVNLTNHQL